MHRSGNGTTDEAVEPVVVGLFGAGFPFVDGPTAAFGSDEVLGSDLLGEDAMFVRPIAEDGKTVTVAHRYRETGERERLP